MRVLHLYAGNLYGGVETFLATLARHRAMSNMIPEFGLCFDARLSQELFALNASVHPLGEVRFSRPWTVLKARRTLKRLIAAQRFDVAICHSVWPHAVFAPVVRASGLPLVAWAHNPPAGHWQERLAGRTPPDLLVANSDYTLSKHSGLFDGCKRAVLRLPVAMMDTGDRAVIRTEVRREMGADDDQIIVACTSRLESWKGHRLLLESLGTLRELPRWSAWIAGGPQRESEKAYLAELNALASHLGINDRVRFIGQRNDVPRVLRAADIHCQPNTGPEPFGIAFIEALYAGLPVVTTAMGAAPEIVTPECGLLVSPDIEAVGDALKMLICEVSMRDKMSNAAPRRAAELCDPGITMPAIELVLGEMIELRK